jgi:NmrA-like family
LPDLVDLDRDPAVLSRHWITRTQLSDMMGGSPDTKFNLRAQDCVVDSERCGAVAAALLRAGRPMRALVRAPASSAARQLAAAGAALAAGDFTDTEALAAAMPEPPRPSPSPPHPSPGPLRRCGKAAPCLVFSSVAGAIDAHGVPRFASKAAIERVLAASNVPHIVVAPT